MGQAGSEAVMLQVVADRPGSTDRNSLQQGFAVGMELLLRSRAA